MEVGAKKVLSSRKGGGDQKVFRSKGGGGQKSLAKLKIESTICC